MNVIIIIKKNISLRGSRTQQKLEGRVMRDLGGNTGKREVIC